MAASMSFCLYKVFNIKDVKYVRSADLIYNFEGMKEAQKVQEKKTDEIKSNLDTLQKDFQKAVNQYNLDFPVLSKEERMQREKLLSMQQENLKQYSQSAQQNIKDSDDKLTEGVLNQVNAFVEEYAEKEGYDIVLGTTASGNILYAKDYMDITDEVVKALNEQYKTQPASAK